MWALNEEVKEELKMNELQKINEEVVIEELKTLKVVLERTKQQPTPQQIEAAAKLVEAVRATAFNY